MDKPAKRRPGIYIVNLQWTPKDCQAVIKINGKCDTVMQKLMKYLSISVPNYSRTLDPIFKHATDLCKEEQHTSNKPFLTHIKTEETECNGVKTEKCKVYEESNSIFDCAISEKKIKNKQNESSVTSCKKEIVIDTGQGDEDMKYIKKELIVITIRSGDNFNDCCSLFKDNQSHDFDCPNFIDEKNDIPVIIEDDLLVLKNNGTSSIKIENLFSDLGVTGQQNVQNSTSSVAADSKIGKILLLISHLLAEIKYSFSISLLEFFL